MSKHELQDISDVLRDKCPFKIIEREVVVKGERHKVSVGWTDSRNVFLQYLPKNAPDIEKNWQKQEMFSVIPKRQLDIITAEIKKEADLAIAKIEEFIHTECDAEIQEMITNSICTQTPTEQDLRTLFQGAIGERIDKVNTILATMPRPREFQNYRINRKFLLDTGDKRIKEGVTLVMEDHKITLACSNFEQALAVFFSWKEIALFVTTVAS